jgi:hypothetical protein
MREVAPFEIQMDAHVPLISCAGTPANGGHHARRSWSMIYDVTMRKKPDFSPFPAFSRSSRLFRGGEGGGRVARFSTLGRNNSFQPQMDTDKHRLEIGIREHGAPALSSSNRAAFCLFPFRISSVRIRVHSWLTNFGLNGWLRWRLSKAIFPIISFNWQLSGGNAKSRPMDGAQ